MSIAGGLFFVAAASEFGFSGLIPNYLTTVRELFAAREANWRIPTLRLFTLGGMAAGTWLTGWIFDITADYRYAFVIGVAFRIVRKIARHQSATGNQAWRCRTRSST